MVGREWGVKTIDFSFAHQQRKTSCHLTRTMDKIIIQIAIFISSENRAGSRYYKTALTL
jgi:hypothetical protein